MPFRNNHPDQPEPPVCGLCQGEMEPDRWRCRGQGNPHCLGTPRGPGHGNTHDTLQGHLAALTADRQAFAQAITALKAAVETLEQADHNFQSAARAINAAAMDSPDRPAPPPPPADTGGPQVSLHPAYHAAGMKDKYQQIYPEGTIAPADRSLI